MNMQTLFTKIIFLVVITLFEMFQDMRYGVIYPNATERNDWNVIYVLEKAYEHNLDILKLLPNNAYLIKFFLMLVNSINR